MVIGHIMRFTDCYVICYENKNLTSCLQQGLQITVKTKNN